MVENTSDVRSDQAIGKSNITNQEEQVSTDKEDIKARIAMLETERIKKATQEIQIILDKYGVVLQAIAEIPASRINVVPRLND